MDVLGSSSGRLNKQSRNLYAVLDAYRLAAVKLVSTADAAYRRSGVRCVLYNQSAHRIAAHARSKLNIHRLYSYVDLPIGL